jgi:hypothetical protein
VVHASQIATIAAEVTLVQLALKRHAEVVGLRVQWESGVI